MTFRPDVLSEYDCLKKRHDDDEETRPPEWAAPLPLPDGLSEVATLAPEMLPEKIAPWVFDISDRMQCPPDFVGMTAMVALGSLLGNKIGVAPQLRTDWVEVSNLWGLGIGAPGIMKSPAMEEVLRALRRLEVRAHEAHKEKMSTYAAELHLWKLRKDAAEARFKHALKENPSAVFDFSDPEPAAPTERRYYVNDATYEKLGEILANNPNGVLAYRDEMVSLLKTLDAEEYAAARGFFLTAWGGLSRYTFDRIGRGKIIIEGLASVCWARPNRDGLLNMCVGPQVVARGTTGLFSGSDTWFGPICLRRGRTSTASLRRRPAIPPGGVLSVLAALTQGVLAGSSQGVNLDRFPFCGLIPRRTASFWSGGEA
jgi:Protein of unknown function (DUF3987)